MASSKNELDEIPHRELRRMIKMIISDFKDIQEKNKLLNENANGWTDRGRDVRQ